MNHTPARLLASPLARRALWRFAFPLLALTLLIAAVSAFGYRSLSEEIRRETHRTLAVIAEQKRQQLEAWLAEAQVDAEMAGGSPWHPFPVVDQSGDALQTLQSRVVRNAPKGAFWAVARRTKKGQGSSSNVRRRR